MRSDADEGVRDEAAGVLLDIALGATRPTSRPAVPPWRRWRTCRGRRAEASVLVAKTAKRESVSRAALGGLVADQKALGSVARRAEVPAIRLEALARDHRFGGAAGDGLAQQLPRRVGGALERIASDRATLKNVATRAANPAAARRARSLLRALDDADAAEAARDKARVAAIEARRRGWLDLIREVEQLASHAAAPDAADRLSRLITRWGAEAAEVDAAVGQRFEAAVASTQEALERAEAERAAEARRQEAVEQAIADRKALVERLESLGAMRPRAGDDHVGVAGLAGRRSSRARESGGPIRRRRAPDRATGARPGRARRAPEALDGSRDRPRSGGRRRTVSRRARASPAIAAAATGLERRGRWPRA